MKSSHMPSVAASKELKESQKLSLTYAAGPVPWMKLLKSPRPQYQRQQLDPAPFVAHGNVCIEMTSAARHSHSIHPNSVGGGVQQEKHATQTDLACSGRGQSKRRSCKASGESCSTNVPCLSVAWGQSDFCAFAHVAPNSNAHMFRLRHQHLRHVLMPKHCLASLE